MLEPETCRGAASPPITGRCRVWRAGLAESTPRPRVPMRPCRMIPIIETAATACRP